MKAMLRLLACLTALALCFSCTAIAEEEVAYYSDITLVSDYQDEVSGRAAMTLVMQGNGDLFATISWASSANEVTNWYFSCNIITDAVDSQYNYSDCQCVTTVYGENESEQTTTAYENGTGALIVNETGFLWADAQEDAGKDVRFVPVGEAFAITRFQDVISQRAAMELSGMMEESSVPMDVTITWGEGADATRIWTMTVMSPDTILDPADAPVLSYSDCTEMLFTTGADGEETVEVISENGSGCFELIFEDDLGYRWLPDGADPETACVFMPVKIAGPVMTESADADAEDWAAQFDLFFAKVDGQMLIALDSVGTMDNDADTYCLDGYLLSVSGGAEEGISVSYNTEDDFLRLILAADLNAVVPADPEAPENGEAAVITGAAAFCDWYQEFIAKCPEDTRMYFVCTLNELDEVAALECMLLP